MQCHHPPKAIYEDVTVVADVVSGLFLILGGAEQAGITQQLLASRNG